MRIRATGAKLFLALFLFSFPLQAGNEAGANGDRIAAWFMSLCWHLVDEFQAADKEGRHLIQSSVVFEDDVEADALKPKPLDAETFKEYLPARVFLASDEFMTGPDGEVQDVRSEDRAETSDSGTDQVIYLRESVWRQLYEQNLPDYRLAFYAMLKFSDSDNNGDLSKKCALELPLKEITSAPYSDRLVNTPPQFVPKNAAMYESPYGGMHVEKNTLKAWFVAHGQTILSRLPQIRQQDWLFSQVKENDLKEALQSRIVLVGDDTSEEKNSDIQWKEPKDGTPFLQLVKKQNAVVYFSGGTPTIYLWVPLWSDLYLFKEPDFRLIFHALLLAAHYPDETYGYSYRLPLKEIITSPFYDELVVDGVIKLPPEVDLPLLGEAGETSDKLKSWYQELSAKVAQYIKAHPEIYIDYYFNGIPPQTHVVVIGAQDEDFMRDDDGEVADILVKFYDKNPTVYLRQATWQEMYNAKNPDYRLVFHSWCYTVGAPDNDYRYSSRLPVEELKKIP